MIKIIKTVRTIEDGYTQKGENSMKYEVPIYEKSNLTLEEAAAYFIPIDENIQQDYAA